MKRKNPSTQNIASKVVVEEATNDEVTDDNKEEERDLNNDEVFAEEMA